MQKTTSDEIMATNFSNFVEDINVEISMLSEPQTQVKLKQQQTGLFPSVSLLVTY